MKRVFYSVFEWFKTFFTKNNVLEIVNISKNATPKYAKEHDSGMDIAIMLDDEFINILPNNNYKLRTGIFVNLPQNIGVNIRPRSSIFAKGIIMDGTIDNGYHGELILSIFNVSQNIVRLDSGERVGQMVFEQPVIIKQIVQKHSLSDFSRTTERGNGGFGHSGKN